MEYEQLSPWNVARGFFKTFSRREDLFEHVYVDVSIKPGGWAHSFDRGKWRTYSVAIDPEAITPELIANRKSNEQVVLLRLTSPEQESDQYIQIDRPVDVQGDIVEAFALRSLLDAEVKNIDLLRTDCRGLDLPVLSGLNFTRFRPRMIVLKAHRQLQSFGHSDLQVVKLLESCGYTAYMLLQEFENGRRKCVFFGPAEKGYELRTRGQDENYIFVDTGVSPYFEGQFVPDDADRPVSREQALADEQVDLD